MDQQPLSKDSPCIGVCTLNQHLICNGCGRTIQEIENAGDKRSLPIVLAERNTHSIPSNPKYTQIN